MDRPLLSSIFARFRSGLERRRSAVNAATGRFPKRQIFLAFNDCKPWLSDHFGCPVTSRWSVGRSASPNDVAAECGDAHSNGSDTLVIEYLVDYGICRHSIPQAIRQPKEKLPDLAQDQKYRMLLAVESELGDDTEVARDFLKLLDVKAVVKCLIFRKRKDHAALYSRLSWTLAHHAACDPAESIMLVGLPRARDAVLTIEEFEIKCVDGTQIVAL